MARKCVSTFANEYDLSRIPPLQVPKSIEDIPPSIEEKLAENFV
jgi:hypothetical protein